MLRCFIADDSPHFVDAARSLLEGEGVEVVGAASTTAEALERVEQLRPDVALLDINLGGDSGFELARRLHREVHFAPGRMILISTHSEDDYLDLIAASPAIGFLSKSSLSASAIRDLLRRRGDPESLAPLIGPPGK